MAQVPFKLFVERGDSSREVAKDHPLHWLLYRKPNRWQTSFEFRETVMLHLVLTGNAYVFLGKVGVSREIREMVPLEPQLITVDRTKEGALRYTYRPVNGPAATFNQESIWHIRGASWNSWLGLEPVKLAREAIGLAIATESAHSEFHKSGARVSGAYSVDGALSKERYALLTEYLDKYAMGGDRAGKPLLLDNGAKWLAQQMTGVDA
ncbi:MAG: phage portal protein, partial [Aestuariivirga sp.]